MVEVTLADSSFSGLPLRIAFDPHFLINALRLGFRRLHMQSPCLTVFCVVGRNKYVLAAVHDSLSICPTGSMQTVSTASSLMVA